MDENNQTFVFSGLKKKGFVNSGCTIKWSLS
jgi:hypothetical protein